jgi:hypothetical protein
MIVNNAQKDKNDSAQLIVKTPVVGGKLVHTQNIENK